MSKTRKFTYHQTLKKSKLQLIFAIQNIPIKKKKLPG